MTIELIERDYCGEMRKIVDIATAAGSYVPKTVAKEIVERLKANDPGLLRGWLWAQAAHFVWQMINDRDRSARSTARATEGRRRFRAAADAHDNGNTEPIRAFLILPFTVEDGSRKQLGKLNRGDLLFVADTYDQRARENALMSAFLKAVAKKVGDDLVQDHYTDEKLADLFDSIRGIG